ncbi:MFS transporter [Nocardioides zeae]|uniref:MFS family permease n=1 Tax=Nocardioides zeae TaxID=1457234 RepID=A0AAJ1U5Z6_9ACTN|nr:MFS transporter [Nocardioides zeae]MDQ1103857.1 MFS family permease [Nocardioides zeae]
MTAGSDAVAPTTPFPDRPDDAARIQRRTVVVLVLAQAVGAVGITIGIATASLLARDLSGSDAQAGLAQTAQVVGAAAAAYVLAGLMASRGRRVGLLAGMLTGAAGAALAVVAGVIGSMALLLVGSALLGAMTAANSGSRYAAVDLAAPLRRGRALSLVVWATTVGAVAGPNLTGVSGWIARRIGVPELTGPFVIGAVAMLLAALVVGVGLRPDPLLTARRLAAGTAGSAPVRRRGIDWAVVREVLATRPAVTAAVVALACAHAVMVAVMVMTPLHMEHGGAELDVIGLVISIHVLGMFAFSPLVGLVADRGGRGPALGIGAAVLLVALGLAGTSPEGHSWHIATGLFLLGLGWSFATVAASTAIADGTPLEARTDVQGASDMVMGLTAAVGGALAGVVVGAWGFGWLAAGAAVLVLALFGAAAVTVRAGAARSDEGHDPT